MTTSDRAWSELPTELVEEVILKIDCPEDVLRFSRVCRAWFLAFMRIRPKWTPANPWILLSENTNDNPEGLRKAYNPGNNKSYQLKMPEIAGCNCWGSDLGWIVTMGLDLKMSLFNPLTKLRLYLPDTSTLIPPTIENANPGDELDYQVCNQDCVDYPYWMRETCILRACVFKTGKTLKLDNGENNEDSDDDDDDDNDGLFVAIVHVKDREIHLDYKVSVKSTCLSIARPGDTRWTLIESPPELLFIRDVLFCRDLLWFGDNKGSLWCVDLNKGFKSTEFLVKPQFPDTDKNPLAYLVKSFNQQLLLVMRFGRGKTHYTMTDYEYEDDNFCDVHGPISIQRIHRNSISIFTTRFVVYKLDFGSKMWKPMNTSDLDGVTMFLGKNTSLLVGASKVSTCKSNCIYFAGDHIYKCGHDTGIYNLDSKNIEAFYEGDDIDTGDSKSTEAFYEGDGDFCIPFWFTPLLY